MDAARQRWLGAHPYLAPVARFDEVVSLALDAASPGPAVAEPDWEGYLPDFHAGVPLLRSAAAGLDASATIAELLGGLVERLAVEERLPGKVREGCCSLAEAWRADPPGRLRAVRWVLSGGEEGAAAGQPGLLQYLGWSAAARALAPVSATFAAWRDEERWGHGHCPTCGAHPVMGWLVPGEGVRERQLSCGCCRTRWGFQRIGCAYCGNADSGRLSILEAEEDGGLRLDLCEECKGYTKTWAGEGDPALLLADWTSLHLDVLARGRGYQRKGASLYEL